MGRRSRWSRWRCCPSRGWGASLPDEPVGGLVEVPVLFESGIEGVFDPTVAVVAGEEVRRARAEARGHALVAERDARQLTQEEKASRAAHVIENDGKGDDLGRPLSGLVEKLRR